MTYTNMSSLLRTQRPSQKAAAVRAAHNRAARAQQAARHTRQPARHPLKYDTLGEALIERAHAYLRANEPTHQLTHGLVDAVMTIIAQRTGEPVRIQIGKAPAFQRAPAVKRIA